MPDPGSGAERVLADPDLDRRLADDGLVVLPMAEPDELRAIEAAYWDLVPDDEAGIVLDYLRTDRALARTLAELMEPVWARVVPQVFEQHYPVYSSFVVKHPGEDSSLYLHRDLHVDDERVRRTFSLWMPFVDTGPDLANGPLSFVRGSDQIRYGGFGPNAVGLFAPYEAHLNSLLEPVAVPAGSGLVYDAKLLHASAPNRTAQVRLAVGCLLARRDQPVIQVMASGRRHRVVHEVDRGYFAEHPPQVIADAGMPSRYPVIDEYEEKPALTAPAVLGAMAEGSDLVREVIVPDDLEGIAGERRPLTVTRGRAPRHAHDLPIVAGDLAPTASCVADGIEVQTAGSVGSVDLVRHRRRVGRPPSAVTDVIVPLDPVRTRDAALVVVDPGGRATFTAGKRRYHRAEVVVIECPAVRAGACSTDQVVELDLGVRVPLMPAEPLHLWNEGPGPLVVVVRSTLAIGQPARRDEGPTPLSTTRAPWDPRASSGSISPRSAGIDSRRPTKEPDPATSE